LLALKNVALLPHLGSSTIEARTGMGKKVIANIAAFLEGKPLPDKVSPALKTGGVPLPPCFGRSAGKISRF
jgi:glyoxylate reductase